MSIIFNPHPLRELEDFINEAKPQLLESFIVNPYVLFFLRIEVRYDVLALVLVLCWL